eukprot:scaffold3092_cov153-Skeletonema_marinoi.AAC.17
MGYILVVGDQKLKGSASSRAEANTYVEKRPVKVSLSALFVPSSETRVKLDISEQTKKNKLDDDVPDPPCY